MIPVQSSSVYQTTLLQAGIGTLCTVLFWFLSTAAGTSALMALGCVLLPTTYFAWLQRRTLNATRILLHGVIKMILTVVLMAVCIVKVGIDPLGFFVTFALMQLSYVFSKGFERTGE